MKASSKLLFLNIFKLVCIDHKGINITDFFIFERWNYHVWLLILLDSYWKRFGRDGCRRKISYSILIEGDPHRLICLCCMTESNLSVWRILHLFQITMPTNDVNGFFLPDEGVYLLG